MPARNPFATFAVNPSGGFDNMAEIAPSDSNELDVVAEALFIAGVPANLSVKVTTVGGQEVSLAAHFFNPENGRLYPPIRIRKVWATGTTSGLPVFALW